jgi:MFS family permease
LTPIHPFAKDRLWTRSLRLLLAVSWLVCFGFYMLPATLPAHVMQIGGTPLQASLVIGLFSVTSLVSRVMSGTAIDAVGERPITLAGIVIIAATTLSFIWMPVAGILLLRGLQGIGWGLCTAAIATAVYKEVPQGRRAEGSGYYALTVIISVSLTPMVAILLMGAFDYAIVLIVAALLPLAALPFAQMGMAKTRSPGPMKRGTGALRFANVFERGAVLPSVLCCILTVPLSGIMVYLVLFGAERHLEHVWVFFIGYSLMILVTRPFIGRLFDRKGHRIIVVPGSVSMLLGLVALSHAQSVALLVAASTLYGLGYGAVQPSLQTWAVDRCPHDRKAAANGLFLSAVDLGYIIGAVALGQVAAATGYAGMYGWGAGVMALFLVAYLTATSKTDGPQARTRRQ